MIKKLATIAAAAAILGFSAAPVFAQANPNANCIGQDVSVEGPQGEVSGEVQAALEFARGSGVTLGSLVSAIDKLPSCTINCTIYATNNKYF